MSKRQCDPISSWAMRATSDDLAALAEYHRQRRDHNAASTEGAEAQYFKKDNQHLRKVIPHLQEAVQESVKEAVSTCCSVDATENKKFSRFDLRERDQIHKHAPSSHTVRRWREHNKRVQTSISSSTRKPDKPRPSSTSGACGAAVADIPRVPSPHAEKYMSDHMHFEDDRYPITPRSNNDHVSVEGVEGEKYFDDTGEEGDLSDYDCENDMMHNGKDGKEDKEEKREEGPEGTGDYDRRELAHFLQFLYYV